MRDIDDPTSSGPWPPSGGGQVDERMDACVANPGLESRIQLRIDCLRTSGADLSSTTSRVQLASGLRNDGR